MNGWRLGVVTSFGVGCHEKWLSWSDVVRRQALTVATAKLNESEAKVDEIAADRDRIARQRDAFAAALRAAGIKLPE